MSGADVGPRPRPGLPAPHVELSIQCANGHPMALKFNRFTKGAFLGCSTFPDCRETRELPTILVAAGGLIFGLVQIRRARRSLERIRARWNALFGVGADLYPLRPRHAIIVSSERPGRCCSPTYPHVQWAPADGQEHWLVSPPMLSVEIIPDTKRVPAGWAMRKGRS